MNPVVFLDQVAVAVHANLAEGIEQLRNELLSDKNRSLSDASITEICDRLYLATKSVYDRNIDKLRIYASRNIFTVVDQESEVVESTTAVVPITDEEHLSLRRRCQELREEWKQVLECARNSDALLKDMRSALFTVRIGAQALEDNEVQPIVESVSSMTSYKNKLALLCREATEYTNQMEVAGISAGISGIARSSSSSEMELGGIGASGRIETGDAADIALVAKNVRAK